MTRLTTQELQALHDAKDWKALWVAAIPWVKMAASSFRTADKEDLIQHGLLAVGPAVRSWDPAKSLFAARMYSIAKYSMFKRLRRAARDAHAETELEQDTEQDASAPPGVTYADLGDIPQGFGDPVAELARMGAPEAVDRLLRRLPAEVALWLRELWGLPAFDEHPDPSNIKTIAAARGVPRTTMNDILRKAKDFLVTEPGGGHLSGTSSIKPPEGRQSWRTHLPVAEYRPGFWDMGLASAMGDHEAWRESTGSVWKDWAWKPDASVQAALSRGSRK